MQRQMDRQKQHSNSRKVRVQGGSQKMTHLSLGEGGSDLGRGLVMGLRSKVDAFRLAVMVGSAKCVSNRLGCWLLCCRTWYSETNTEPQWNRHWTTMKQTLNISETKIDHQWNTQHQWNTLNNNETNSETHSTTVKQTLNNSETNTQQQWLTCIWHGKCLSKKYINNQNNTIREKKRWGLSGGGISLRREQQKQAVSKTKKKKMEVKVRGFLPTTRVWIWHWLKEASIHFHHL